MWSIPLLPLFPGPHWLRVVVTVRHPFIEQTELFTNYSYSVGSMCAIKKKEKKRKEEKKQQKTLKKHLLLLKKNENENMNVQERNLLTSWHKIKANTLTFH